MWDRGLERIFAGVLRDAHWKPELAVAVELLSGAATLNAVAEGIWGCTTPCVQGRSGWGSQICQGYAAAPHVIVVKNIPQVATGLVAIAKSSVDGPVASPMSSAKASLSASAQPTLTGSPQEGTVGLTSEFRYSSRSDTAQASEEETRVGSARPRCLAIFGMLFRPRPVRGVGRPVEGSGEADAVVAAPWPGGWC
jgi:hypothetical protein